MLRYNETLQLAPNFTQKCTYTIRIRALNDAGAGNWSAPINHFVSNSKCICSAGYTGECVSVYW